MVKVVYRGKNNKYHDKNTNVIFVRGKEYEYSEERLKELNVGSGGLFERVDVEESEVIDVSKESYPKKEDLIEAYEPEGVTVQDKRDDIEKAIREQNS